MRNTRIRRAAHPSTQPPKAVAVSIPVTNVFSPDALRSLLSTTQVTSAATYIQNGRSGEDYRGSIWMYIDRYLQSGELLSLAKAILKTVSLRTWISNNNR